MCAKILPFNVVNREGFQGLIGSIRPDLKLPSNTHLSANILPIAYERCKQAIRQFVAANFEYGSISTDIWIDNHLLNKYLALNLLFLDKDLKWQKVQLSCMKLDTPHTSQRISARIDDQLIYYNINSSKVFFLSDSGANVRSAISNYPSNYGYASHGLHSLVTVDCLNDTDDDHYIRIIDGTEQDDDLSSIPDQPNTESSETQSSQTTPNQSQTNVDQQTENANDREQSQGGHSNDSFMTEDDVTFMSIKELLAKCKKIYNKLKYHKQLLRDTQLTLLAAIDDLASLFDESAFSYESEPTAILNSVKTRWNSINTMLRSIVDKVALINEALQQLLALHSDRVELLDLQITPSEQILMRELIIQLDPVEKYTKELSSDKLVGCKTVLGYMELEDFFHQDKDQLYCREIKLFRMKFRLNLPRRVKLTEPHFLQAILDPNCRASPRIDRMLENLNEPTSCVQLLQHYINPSPTPRTASSNPISQRLEAVESGLPNQVSVNDDIMSYLNAGRSTEYIDPIDYWRSNQQSVLFPLFKKYGSLIPSTVVSERTFSKCSLIDTEKRSRLLDTNLEAIVFMHENLKLSEEALTAAADQLVNVPDTSNDRNQNIR